MELMLLRQEKEEALEAVRAELQTDVQNAQQKLGRKCHKKEVLCVSEWYCWNLINLFQ